MEIQPPSDSPAASPLPAIRGYQQEMLEESLRKNLIIALDTGSGKTLIAILRMKIEAEREAKKVSWFLAPTVALCDQQKSAISQALPVSVGQISGSQEPNQWKDPGLWRGVLEQHRVMVTTPQVLLDALRHGYVHLGTDIGLLTFDEAHHAVDNHPYNAIMKEFYFKLPSRDVADGNNLRPMILGLTASPIYGGHVEKAFKTIEGNLDSFIRAPQIHLDEMATFVHRPVFKHVQYEGASYDDIVSPSHNVAALEAVLATMNIENDPWVQSMREQLCNLPIGSERTRVDQKLSKAISKGNTYTHKGLKDFARAASEICADVGPWAADWYVEMVLEQAKTAATPYQTIVSEWQNKEKLYLLGILAQVQIIPVSYQPEVILAGISDKTRVLIESLQAEKTSTETYGEDYSGIIFATRRDAVLALTEVLSHHPGTEKTFRVGCLLGSSNSASRNAFLDITRRMLTQTQTEVLLDFKVKEKNLIVSTAVAEEGIDIQACGSVIRWDIPMNMTSWAQSRGRARRERSTFILMFDNLHVHDGLVSKWERLEKEMQTSYNNTRKRKEEGEGLMSNEDEEYLEFGIESTGWFSALVTTNSVVSHLNHFCSVLPNSPYATLVPLYDIDPPDHQEGWHSMEHRSESLIPYRGPYGSTVTLPRQLRADLRVFSTERVHPTKRAAHRHVAFKAYIALYKTGLLNNFLLPLLVDRDLEEEVGALLKDIENRTGTANVTGQMSPWAPIAESDTWWCSELAIDGLPPLYMITWTQPPNFSGYEFPLYHPYRHPLKVVINAADTADLPVGTIEKAKQFTRRVFWEMYSPQMSWDELNFAYLFLPVSDVNEPPEWVERRSWLDSLNSREGSISPEAEFHANAAAFGKQFSYPDDLTIIQERGQGVKNYRFLRWRFDPLSAGEEQSFRKRNSLSRKDTINLPLLVVKRFPQRMNFLVPFIPPEGKRSTEIELLFQPEFLTVNFLSANDTDYALLLPSIIRHISMAMIVSSLRTTLLTPSLAKIPLDLLTTAVTAPESGAHFDYHRLETLGDTVLKFTVGPQLLAEYPYWHESYLSRKKDHSVSNARLAKEAHAKGLYRWIIRMRFPTQEWKPEYITSSIGETRVQQGTTDINGKESTEESQELPTKLLVDVVQSLIGAAYLHGGFDLAVECCQLFGLGLAWDRILCRVQTILSRVKPTDDFPTQITTVERMLGYKFERKLLLVEALTHSSHQFDDRTVSYERMKFLGESVLDMVVTDYLYHAPGKQYKPDHIHLRKSAVINTHFLAYICLRCSLMVDASMPRPNGQGDITVYSENQAVYLWQCLLHSSPRILDDFNNTFARYQKNRDEIENALNNKKIFPWAALTRLQAPKLFSDMIESLLGAIYLDSNGDLSVARRVVKTLGILPILERIVQDDVDVLHPVSRLAVWASRRAKKVEYVFEKDQGYITCMILLDGKEEFRVTDTCQGLASQNEVKFAAAEKAIMELQLREQEPIDAEDE